MNDEKGKTMSFRKRRTTVFKDKQVSMTSWDGSDVETKREAKKQVKRRKSMAIANKNKVNLMTGEIKEDQRPSDKDEQEEIQEEIQEEEEMEV
jgi:hypothetical protein